MYLDCVYFNYLLNVFGLWMFEKILSSGLCCCVKKYAGLNVGIIIKQKIYLKKSSRIGLGCYLD